MSYLYVCEQGATVGVTDNRFQVKYKTQGVMSTIPIEMVEVIQVFGKIQLTTQCLTECLKRGINVIYYSANGAYYGRLISTSNVNVNRQRKQAELGKNEKFMVSFSKKIIDAKIKNQITILRRIARYKRDINIDTEINNMKYMIWKVSKANSVEQIMGYEGYAAKIYFELLSKLIVKRFAFTGRNRRPPKDPFNSMISLGYSMIVNEFYGKIEAKGLNPYFGFMHKDKEKHPTLASDLMEEWRAVIIDSTVMNMMNNNEITTDDFYTDIENPGIYLTKDALKKYIKKLEVKYRTKNRYLTYVDYDVDFRRAMDLQVNQLCKAIEEADTTYYNPLIIR